MASPHSLKIASTVFLLLVALRCVAYPHPGSGIFVDREGRVYFVDTGHGVWMIDRSGRVREFHRNPFHWMAMDEEGGFAGAKLSIRTPTSELLRITPDGSRPALINSSDFPVTIGRDGRLYYPTLEPPLKMLARSPRGEVSTVAAISSRADGSALRWINGLAAAPNGDLYFTEDDAVRRITPAGEVRTLAYPVRVDGCSSEPLPEAPAGPLLRGLAVEADGSVYVAASGCRALLKVSPDGKTKTVAQAEPPWSPTGVAVAAAGIYVLEYVHTTGDDRRDWVPRVRKISPGGKVTVLAEIRRGQAGRVR